MNIRRNCLSLCLSLCVLVTVSACNDLSGLAGHQELPSGTPDPASFNTSAGALALYQGTISGFQAGQRDTASNIGGSLGSQTLGVFVNAVLGSGLISDELTAGNFGGVQTNYTSISYTNLVDARQLTEGARKDLVNSLYVGLNGIRGGANLAIGALAKFDSSAPPALRGHMYALRGYAEILLADMFCSGVPLSTLDFQADYSYQPGSTTAQVYQKAIADFDTALTLSVDSVRIENLAAVGKGRAFLALNQYDSAAAAVTGVPDGFAYRFPVDWQGGSINCSVWCSFYSNEGGITVANIEGGNGLPYITNGMNDPRTATRIVDSNSFNKVRYAPIKYDSTGPGVYPVTVADWIEARLIRAEADLATGDISDWLGQLNYLRQNATTPQLPQLSDPGDHDMRIALLFQERAYWLFLTGHRNGDLRRLIRQYGYEPDAVYPTGTYPLFGQLSNYGDDITMPVPSTEHANPLFTGCLSRGA